MLPETSRFRQSIPWLAAALAIVLLAYLLSPILTPFLLAAILAYICNPLVDRLEGKRVPRVLGAVLVLLLLASILAGLVLVLYPLIQREVTTVIQRLPAAVDLFNKRIAPWLHSNFGVSLSLDTDTAKELVIENWDSAQEIIKRVLASLRLGGLAVIGFVANMLLVPVVMFYVLWEWPQIVARIDGAIPRPWHLRARRIVGDIDAVLAEFLRGQSLVMLALAVFYSVGLWIAGLHSWLALGVLSGLLVFIPYLGFAMGFTLALVAAILQFGGWSPVIGTLVVFGLGQLLESWLLTPYLVGERIGLHPLTVIFALLAFGQLFGFFGVLVALPASAAMLVGLRELRGEYLASPFYRG